MATILEVFKVESDSTPGSWYTVSETAETGWQCSCVGWTRHFPRRDCKHIRWAKMGGAVAVDPLLRAVEVTQRKQSSKSPRA